MNELLEINKQYVLDKDIYWNNNTIIEKIVNILNKKRLVIVSGLRNIWKLSILKELLIKSKLDNDFFYFNKNLDYNNKIINDEKLEKLLNEYIELYKKPKIIILENFWKIKWIKNFIPKIFKENYKIILIWNNIKISKVKEIEVLKLNNNNISEPNNNTLIQTLSYWNLPEVTRIDKIQIKQKYINLVKSDIYLNEIIQNFWVKNIFLYNSVITFIANINYFTSLRELQREIEKVEKISLKTLIDYINFAIKSKLIKQVYKYDLKKDKVISSKSKYYFIDTWIRNSYQNFNINKNVLFENYIFLELLKKWYKIFSWKNWKFDFDFIVEKKLKTSPQSSPQGEEVDQNEKFYFHISKQTEKDEIKKEIKKLNKISDDFKKFLIISEIEKYNFKKFEYGNVKLIDIKNTEF